METSKNETEQETHVVLDIARILEDHRAQKVVALDLREQSTWTDYFLIATVTSSAHLKGLVREMRDFLAEKDIPMLHKHRTLGDDGWEWVDCGDFVVHLMTEELREFYNLEELWYQALRIWPAASENVAS